MQYLKFENYSLGLLDAEDCPHVVGFVNELFEDSETAVFFTLSDEDRDKDVFVNSMVEVNKTKHGIDCIIFDNHQNKIGLLLCELDSKWHLDSNIYWSIGLTIHPAYRHQGYATRILKDICSVLRQYRFEEVVLDISEDDIYMEKAAQSAGYKKRINRYNSFRIGRIDALHPEIGLHNLWIRKIHEYKVSATDFVTGLLGKSKNDVARTQLVPNSSLVKYHEHQISDTLNEVFFALSQSERFSVMFDADYGGISVRQITCKHPADEVSKIYDILKCGAVKNKVYPLADGFFIENDRLGYIFIEKVEIEGIPCIRASLESILYE